MGTSNNGSILKKSAFTAMVFPCPVLAMVKVLRGHNCTLIIVVYLLPSQQKKEKTKRFSIQGSTTLIPVAVVNSSTTA